MIFWSARAISTTDEKGAREERETEENATVVQFVDVRLLLADGLSV